MAQNQLIPASLTRRRFLQYTGSMALGSSFLAACAGTGGSTSTGGGSTSSGPVLQQWYHQYGEVGTHEAVLKYAKEYTKAKVNVSWLPGTGGDYGNKVQAALLGSNPPDVFEQSGIGVDLVKAGAVADLSDLIADVKSDFTPASLAPFTVDGKLYGIKMINDPTFVYYRKSLFQKAGLQPPTTVDELIKAAKTLTTGKMKGIYIGPDGGVDALSYMALWSSGGTTLSDDSTKVTFNTDRTAQALLKIHELNASGGVLPDAPTFWWDPSAFTQGLVAMQWCGLWAMPGITKVLGDDFGIFPYPPLDSKSQPATVNGGWAEMVSAKSKNLQAAKDYVKWLWITSADIQKDWNVGYGFHVPPRNTTAAATDKLKTGTAAQAVDILNKYGHSNSPYWDAAMGSAYTEAVSTIVKNGPANALSILNTAADKCSAELTKLHG
jgi:multiple sugar transport system substrate-binding protein